MVLRGSAQTVNPVTTLVSAAKKVAPPLQKRNVAAVVSAAKSAAQPIPVPIKAPTQAPAAKSSIASAAQQAVPPAIRAAADKIKQEYLAKTYPMLSAADKAGLQSTELGRAMSALSNTLKPCERCLDQAALIAAQGEQLQMVLDEEMLVKHRILHSSCTKLEFSSKSLDRPVLKGGHLDCDGALKSSEHFTVTELGERDGCKALKIDLGTRTDIRKTTGPEHWDAIMLDFKNREALSNATFFTAEDESIIKSIAELKESAITNNRWTAIGKTSEGIEIKLALEYKNNKIEIVSGYIHDLWIFGLR